MAAPSSASNLSPRRGYRRCRTCDVRYYIKECRCDPTNCVDCSTWCCECWFLSREVSRFLDGRELTNNLQLTNMFISYRNSAKKLESVETEKLQLEVEKMGLTEQLKDMVRAKEAVLNDLHNRLVEQEKKTTAEIEAIKNEFDEERIRNQMTVLKLEAEKELLEKNMEEFKENENRRMEEEKEMQKEMEAMNRELEEERIRHQMTSLKLDVAVERGRRMEMEMQLLEKNMEEFKEKKKNPRTLTGVGNERFGAYKMTGSGGMAETHDPNNQTVAGTGGNEFFGADMKASSGGPKAPATAGAKAGNHEDNASDA